MDRAKATLSVTRVLGTQPYPRRGATSELERRFVQFFKESRPKPGTSLATDSEVAAASRLSHSTVRRVMERLDRAGWVSRQPGRGTFVGERVLLLDEPAESVRDERSIADTTALTAALRQGAAASHQASARAGLRVAVLISRIEDLAHDWFSLGVIAGLDAAAADCGGRIEIIGTRERRPEVLSRRLAEAMPDALAYLTWHPEYLSVLDVAHQLGIATIFGSTAFSRPSWSGVVFEDNTHAVELAVDALWQAGHRDIALAINRWPEPWVFERQFAFENAIERRGGEADDARVCWLGSEGTMINVTRRSHTPPSSLDLEDRHEQELVSMVSRLERFLSRNRPSALIAGSQVVADVLGRLVRCGGVCVPEDLSVVCIDQHPQLTNWYGLEPTTVCLPLAALGRGIFEAAVEMSGAGGSMVAPPPVRRVRCTLSAGQSVRTLID